MNARLVMKLSLFLLLFGSLRLPRPAFSQTILGSVSGAITDATDAAIPNASIVVKNLDTDAVRTTVSQTNGSYVIPSLLAGRYSLTVTAAQFKTFTQEEFRLLVNEAQTINVRMETGEVSQSITVSGQPTPLNEVDSTLSNTVQNVEINELPLNGRHFTQLLELSPGVVMHEGGQQSSFTVSLGAGGLSPSINGMRPESNNYTLDGVENNSRYTNTYGSSPPPDAIQEFKVETQDNNPQSALAAGGGISVTTKSGTNQFHGSLWEYLRNDKLSANGYFNNFFNNPRVPYKQNQYGLVLGGPMIIPKVMNGRKSQTYLFGYWEGFRSRQTSTLTAQVPDQNVRNGNFSELLGGAAGTDGAGNPVRADQIYDILSTTACTTCTGGFIRSPFPGDTIPANRISPQATAFINYFLPLPNRPGGNPDYARTANLATNSDQYGVRVDHNFSSTRQLFARFSGYDARQLQPQTLPTIQFQLLNTGDNGVIHLTNIVNPRLLLDLQYGYNRTGIANFTTGLASEITNALSPTLLFQVPNGTLAPQIAYTGSIFSAISPLQYHSEGNPDYAHQIAVNLHNFHASHEIVAGFTFMHWNHVDPLEGNDGLTFANTATNQPGFNTSGDGFASFLVGYPNATANNLQPPINTYGDIYVGYVGDEWRARKTLRINFGLQYLLATRPVERNNTVGMLDYAKALTQPNATDFTFAYVWAGTNPITGAPPNASRSLLLAGDHNNFAPRLGIAWSVTPKLVIRTGFGVYYDYGTNLVQNSIRLEDGGYPYGITQTNSGLNTALAGSVTLTNPFPTTTPPGANPTNVLPRRLPDPYSMGWNFGVEYLLPGNTALDVHYVASSSGDLLTTMYQNIAPAGTGPIASRRPIPGLGALAWRANSGHSNYNSLQVGIQKRYSRGFTFRNAFTWARSFDTQSDANQVAVEYIYNRHLSYGPSDYDQPVVDVATAVWDLPVGRGRHWGSNLPNITNSFIGGWQLAGIVTARSGVPYTIHSGIDNANTGSTSAGAFVANIVGNPFPAGFKTQNAWFNTSAFAQPAFGTLGNTSRNMFRGPSYWDFTASVAKAFHLHERSELQFRADFFNAFNHTNFGDPNGTLTSSTFGQILSASEARDIQLALKLVF